MTRPMSLRRARVVERVAPVLKQLYSVAGPSPELAGYVRRHRLDLRTIEAHAGVFTVALAKHYGGNAGERRFMFDPEGIPTVCVEAYEADGYSPMDVIAWPLFQPFEFANAIGEADVLGAWQMLNRGGQPLRVYRTPLDWLKAGCEGCVPLAWPWAGHWLHKAGGPFLAEDFKHGTEIRELLGPFSRFHRVLAPDTRGAAA